MRICVLIDAWEPVWGGGQVHVWETVKRLVEKYNCSIDIFTRRLTGNNGENYSDKEIYCKGKLRLLRTGTLTRFHDLRGRLSWMFNVVKAIYTENKLNSYDLIHAHAYSAGVPGKILNVIIKRPVIFTVHGSNLLDIKENSLTAFIEKIILTKINYTVQITVARNFYNYSNVNKQLVYIPNGVEADRFKHIRKKPGKKYFVYLWVGRFDKIKAVDLLIQSFSMLVRVYKDVKLNLAGSGPERERLQSLIKQAGLEKQVSFLGNLCGNKLVMEYAKADVFVLPSDSEGQPLTILEAFASKLPVIATDVGDNRIMVKNHYTGWIIKPRDPQALFKSLVKSYRNPKLIEMGNNGFNMIRNKFSWENCTAKIFKIYEKYAKN